VHNETVKITLEARKLNLAYNGYFYIFTMVFLLL
jgi:hypothetical protein